MLMASLLVAGLVRLYFGAEWLVRGSASLAVRLGVTPLLVGLTVVGSNIYHILAILGVSGVLASPIDGQGLSLTDTWVMVGISAVLLAIAWTGFQLRRREGALPLATYGGYLWHLWLKT